MDETKRSERIGFINRSMYDPSKLTGTLCWDGGLKFKISNIENDGDYCVADIRRKTGEKYTAKNGVEYDAYEDIGAMRFNRQTNAGELVMNLDGLGPVKYPFQTFLDVDKSGKEVRKMRFKEFATAKKVNAFRTMFDQAATVVSEKVDDEVPF